MALLVVLNVSVDRASALGKNPILVFQTSSSPKDDVKVRTETDLA